MRGLGKNLVTTSLPLWKLSVPRFCLGLLAGIPFAVCAAPAIADAFDPFPPHGCPYVRCADTPNGNPDISVEPIRIFGRTISYYDPAVRPTVDEQYYTFMKQFPNLESCVDSSDPGSQLLTDARIRWRDLGSPLAVRVCVFRLFDAMRDPAVAARWLAASGFTDVRDLPNGQEGSYGYGGGTDPDHDRIRIVTGYWITGENGRLFWLFFRGMVESIFSRGTRLNAAFGPDGDVLNVNVSTIPRIPN
jgi:hypothetical protein